MQRLILALVLFVFYYNSFGQINFEKGNVIYRNGLNHHSGIAGAFCDINGDFYDDLIVLNKSKFLEIGYNKSNGKGLNWQAPEKVNLFEEYCITVADFNNDGIAEIVSGGTFSGTKIYKRENDNVYRKQQDLLPLIYTQAANAVDINNDGFLDYFACHDEGENITLINKKNGLLEAEKIIDFTTVPSSDQSGNYGSEWCDIDNDGDQDLYIAKCKFGITDKEDARRHNMLFINNGNGSFTNEAQERGLKNKGQSWTGSFADIDNDGDMDCIVTNHDDNHTIYKNDGKGYFTEFLSFPTSFAFQSLWADFDNDGFVDLFITGVNETSIYKNSNGQSFEKLPNLFGSGYINSASLGDVNDDGFTDVAAVYGININYPGPNADELFINQKNSNHYIKLGLIGTTSNKQAVGARLSLFGPWGIQSREVQSGVSYGISNSMNQVFGLGQNNKFDSLIVNWPSGKTDKYYDLPLDKIYFIQEDKCITQRVQINAPKDYVCENESISLSLENNYEKYLWSNGSTNAFISVNKGGDYSVIATDANGCNTYSVIKHIEQPLVNGDFILPHNDTTFFCNNISLKAASDLKNILWQGENNSEIFSTNKSQTITLSAENICGKTVRDTLVIKEINDNFSVKNDTLAKGETAILTATGGNLKWYDNTDKKNLIYEGNKLNIFNFQKTTSYFVQSSRTDGVKKYALGETKNPVGNSIGDYPANNKDIGLYLNVYKNITLSSVEVASDMEAIRRILLINYNGDTVARKDVLILNSSKQVIALDFKIPPGTLYQLKTDENINLLNLGFKSPRLKKIEGNTSYPYQASDVADLPTSLRGGFGYYYFFNMQLHDEGIYCESELKEVKAVLDTEVDTKNTILVLDKIHPNPVVDALYIDFGTEKARVEIFSLSGQLLIQKEVQINESLDVSSLDAGLYIIAISESNGNSQKGKFIKVK